MTRTRGIGTLLSALRGVRPKRLAALILVALAIGLIGDWLRQERVIFPPPLPEFKEIRNMK